MRYKRQKRVGKMQLFSLIKVGKMQYFILLTLFGTCLSSFINFFLDSNNQASALGNFDANVFLFDNKIDNYIKYIVLIISIIVFTFFILY
jgi:hypothetical protein